MAASDWTIERIRKLDKDQVRNLQKNATERGNSQVAELCCTVLLEKMTPSERKKALGIASFEKAVASVLSAAAVKLSKEYDLSEETAKANGTAHPHALLGSGGWAKTGGDMLNGDVALDVYISYRLKDTRIAAAVIIRPGETIDKAHYILKGTPDALPEGKPLPGLADESRVGVLFENIEELAAAYGVALGRFAPRKN